jgi:hypothetical protein
LQKALVLGSDFIFGEDVLLIQDVKWKHVLSLS